MYYLKKRLVRTVRRVAGRPTYPSRYQHLYDEVRALRPRRILEVGTNDGIHAARMAEAAREVGVEAAYFGFDLFEHQGREQFLREFSLRTRSTQQVAAYLRRHGVREPRLFAGDSTETLPREAPGLPPMDLVFIDGGHSLETVRADWENVQPLLAPGAVVFFDDYPNWGVAPVVDAIDRGAWDVRVMPNRDRFRVPPEMADNDEDGWMTFQVVRVRRRT